MPGPLSKWTQLDKDYSLPSTLCSTPSTVCSTPSTLCGTWRKLDKGYSPSANPLNAIHTAGPECADVCRARGSGHTRVLGVPRALGVLGVLGPLVLVLVLGVQY